jgi:amino acid permease
MSDRSTSFIVGVCFTLNYIIGTGFLTLPWAFNETGWVLGFLTLLFLSVASIVAVVFILETMARAEEYGNHHKVAAKSYSDDNQAYSAIPDASQHNKDSKIIPFEIEMPEGKHLLNKDRKLYVKDAVYEIPELSGLFLGEYGKMSYVIVVSLYLFIALWVYATVFGSAFATHANIGKYSYQIYILIFSVFVIPVSLMEFKEQVCVQVVLSLCRVLMVLAMIGTILYAHFTSTRLFGNFDPSQNTVSESTFSASNFAGIYVLLPIAAYANIFHHSIPALAQLVSDKSMLNGVFFSALIIAMASYSALGAIVSSYFGDHTLMSSNLNWAHFHGAEGDNVVAQDIANMLGGFIVLFPAFDVASAFPLNAITLANNLMSVYDGQAVHEHENSRLHRTVFRVLVVIPAIMCALSFSNLGIITHFAGLAGFAIAFIYPAILAYYSKRVMEANNMPSNTAYSFSFLSNYSNIVTAILGCGMLLFVASSLIIYGPVD